MPEKWLKTKEAEMFRARRSRLARIIKENGPGGGLPKIKRGRPFLARKLLR